MSAAVTAAARAAVELEQEHHDSWIAVTNEVDRLIAGGSTLQALLPALESMAPGARRRGETEPHRVEAGATMDLGDVTLVDATSNAIPVNSTWSPTDPCSST